MQQLNYNMQPINPQNAVMNTLQYVDILGKMKDQSDLRQAGIQAARAAQAKAEQDAIRQQELGAALGAVRQAPTRENYMALSNLYATQDPEKSKAFRENWNIMEKGQQESIFKDSMNMLYMLESDPEMAVKTLEEQAVAYENSGKKEEAKKYRAFGNLIKTGDIQAVKDSLVMTIGGIPDIGQKAIDTWATWSKEQRDQKLSELQSKNPGKVLDPKDIESSENLLRKEYDSKQSVFKQIGNFYNVITNADKNSIGDIALITTYMKILDPNSVVREGEFLQASQAGGIPSSIVAAYNKALGTGKIDDIVRADIYAQSKKIYDTTKAQNETDKAFYTDIAKRRGLNVDNIIYNKPSATPAATTSVPSATRTAGIRALAKSLFPDESGKIDKMSDAELFNTYKKTVIKYDAGQPVQETETEVDF